jgi:hypothetical protein
MEFLIKNPLSVMRIARGEGAICTLFGGLLPKKIIKAIKDNEKSELKEYFGKNYNDIIKPKIDLNKSSILGGDIESMLEEYEKNLLPENEKLATIGELTDNDALDQPIKQESNQIKNIGFAPADKKLPAAGVEYNISEISIFPEDNIEEFKEKIYVATGVPVQRQHLFWINDVGVVKTTYKMTTLDGGDVITDARNLLKIDKSDNNIFGIEIDRYVYENWSNITVIALDTFKTVSDLLIGITNVVYFIDIADILNINQLNELANEKSKRDVLFYSVLFKYWPWYPTPEDLLDEKSLFSKYPLLAPNREKLQRKIEYESDILYSRKNNISLEIAITMAVVSVSTGCKVNIRNLFDRLQTDKNIPHINAYINDGALKYNLNKHFIGSPFIQFPNKTRSGLTIAIPLYNENFSRQVIESQSGSKITNIFLNIQQNGIYYILCHFVEDNKIDFEKLLTLLAEKINPILDVINLQEKYIFISSIRKLTHLSKLNARYPEINITLTWKKITGENDFKQMKKKWEPYEVAGIVSLKPITFNTNQNIMIELGFYKGCVEYDINHIARSSVLNNIKNYYFHLSNPNINLIWNNIYKGRNVRMVQRTSDIQFEIYGATQNNYLIFRQCLESYLSSIVLSKGQITSKHIKKIKMLQQTDPELFDLRRHGSNKLYTILCQEPRQPVIYSRQEDAPTKAIEYFNLTTKKPVYYHCNSRNHPVLSFITGVHPLGYCLPCCKKAKNEQDSQKYIEDKSCFEKGTFTKQIKSDKKVDYDVAQHIISFGKELPNYRIGSYPKEISDYLASTGFNVENVYIYGVSGIVNILAFVLDTNPKQLVELFLNILKNFGAGYQSLLNGDIVKWFSSSESLIGEIHKKFIQETDDIEIFDKWIELFIELFRITKNIEVIIIDDNIEYSGVSRERGIILIKNEEMLYPLVRIIPMEYYKTGKVETRIFNDIKNITAPLSETKKNIVDDLLLIDKTLKVCVNNQRIAYGVINDSVFITFKSTFAPSNSKLYTDIPIFTADKNYILKIFKEVKKLYAESTIVEEDKIYLKQNNNILLIGYLNDNEKHLWENILQSEKPDEKFTNLLDSANILHNNYNLFLLEFTFHMDKNKNNKLRKIIKSQLEELDINDITSLHKFTNILKTHIDNPNDIGIINSIIAQNINNKNKIIEVFENKKYNFDKEIYRDLLKMSDDELRVMIGDFLNTITVSVNTEYKLKNLTLPGNKIKLSADENKNFIELLIADLRNPLKFDLMRSGILSSYLLLDMFNFDKYPNETIDINL